MTQDAAEAGSKIGNRETALRVVGILLREVFGNRESAVEGLDGTSLVKCVL